MAAKLLLENAIGRTGTVLKNGTGGSAPALDENPDWPTSNTLIRDRGSFWRAEAGGLGPHAGIYVFDYDFGSAVTIGTGGFMRLRIHGPSVIPTTPTCDLLYGASYPPASRVNLALALSGNNGLKDFTQQSARYWRVEVTATDIDGNPMEISGNPWLVEPTNVSTFTNPRAGSRILSRRLRIPVSTPTGAVFHYDPAGQIRGAQYSELTLTYPLDAGGTIVGYLRDVIGVRSERVVILDYENNYIETGLPDGAAEWERVLQTTKRVDARFWSAP